MLKKKNKKVKLLAFTITFLITGLFIFSRMHSNAIVDLVKGKFSNSGSPDANLEKIVTTILGYIQAAGVGIFLGAIVVYGIKIVSADSVKKAEIKEKLIMWVIAGLLIFAGGSIIKTLLSISSKVFKN